MPENPRLSVIRARVRERLRIFREQLKWSQEELAKRSGISLHNISRYEQPSYDRGIKVEKLALLAEALGHSLDEFVQEAGPKIADPCPPSPA